MVEAARTYDVIVFGATGFTGQKTAEYLARHAPRELKWAIAGRSHDKLASVKAALVAIDARHETVGLVEARVDDAASLVRMASATRVLLTTVGPFSDYGEPVARACIEAGTDYLDSSGEPHYVASLVLQHTEAAREKGVRLVPSSGFDAAIADLGVLFTVRPLPKDKSIRISGYVTMKTKFSGGTERSAIKSLGRRAPPLAVVPVGARHVRELPARIHRVAGTSGWAAPFPTVDASVVIRSAASDARYGTDFGYAHHAVHPSLFGLLAALWVFGTVAFLGQFAPFRALFLLLVQKSGQGPTDAEIAAGSFTMRFVAECDGRTTTTEVAGGDPAYGETAKILGEAALCLALDGELLPAGAGVLTPSEAMGDALLLRLTRQGIRFRTISPEEPAGAPP